MTRTAAQGPNWSYICKYIHTYIHMIRTAAQGPT